MSDKDRTLGCMWLAAKEVTNGRTLDVSKRASYRAARIGVQLDRREFDCKLGGGSRLC